MDAEKVDINKANAEELDRMFGVGAATARRIINYRDSELGGAFHDLHDLTHINGIGESTARMIMDNARLK